MSAVLGVLLTAAVLAAAPAAYAGGPKTVAGTSYFNPAVVGQPVTWADGQVNYYVDQGALNSSVSNQQATAMVDAAAAMWNAVRTAGVTLVDRGPLNEDVNGSNIIVSSSGGITAPSDLTPPATNYPVGVIYDADGSVIDAIFGATTSEPEACQNNGVYVWADNINPNATFAHAIIILNGRCATSPALDEMMSFELERAFGEVLGLGFSQVNPGAFTNGEPEGTLGLPVMEPLSGACGASGGACIPNPAVLRYDDIAALNRLYPIAAANLASFPGKEVTAANTISIRGTISFANGYGMQGVNVVARPLDANGNPLYQYTVTAVSGVLFNGNHGNPVTGFTDAKGNPLTQWGSEDAAEQGSFDVSGIPLPPGVTAANYQVTFEAISPLYILENTVGPYADGQVEPSGTLKAIVLAALAAGSTRSLTVTAAGSAQAAYDDAIGTQTQPQPMPATGMWCGRLSQVGQTDWFTFPVRGNRTFTVVTQALNESGMPSEAKAMPSIGVWDAFDAVGAPAVGAAPGLNGLATGETWLQVSASGDDIVRIGVADLRGDGRPDYAYNGWVLYADTVSPARLPASGGTITIQGMGFRPDDTVLVGGQTALVVSISPTQITAIAPPAASGATGSMNVEVEDEPLFYASTIVIRRGKLRFWKRRCAHAGDGSHEHRAHGRAHALYGHRAWLEPGPGGRRDRYLHGDQRRGHAGVRLRGVHGHHHRRWTRDHERDGGRRHVVRGHGFADQRVKPAGRVFRGNAAHADRAYAPAFGGCRRHFYLDGAGACIKQRRAGCRAVSHLAIGEWDYRAGGGYRDYQLQRHRHGDADRGAFERRTAGLYPGLPERDRPMRCVYGIGRAS